MRLIVHADDYGYSQSVNDAIYELCKLGALSSASIMANMPFTNEAYKLLDIDNVSLGLHSTFTQGRPISKPEMVPTLVTKDGFFNDYATMAKNAKKGVINSKEIVTELRNQYNFVKEIIGDKLTFLDAHHSIHNKLIPFRRAFIQFGREFDKKIYLRTSQFHYIVKKGDYYYFQQPSYKSLLKYGPRKVLINYFYKHGATLFAKSFKITDGQITAILNPNETIFHRLYKVSDIGAYDKTIYVVAHPATKTDDLKDTILTQQRVDEYNTLKSSSFLHFLSKVNLTNFSSI